MAEVRKTPCGRWGKAAVFVTEDELLWIRRKHSNLVGTGGSRACCITWMESWNSVVFFKHRWKPYIHSGFVASKHKLQSSQRSAGNLLTESSWRPAQYLLPTHQNTSTGR